MITKTFKLTIATDTKKQMQKEEEHLSMVYGAEEVKEALDGFIYMGKTLREWIDVIKQTRWIPVSERLPDLWDERYLVSLAWGGIGVMEYKSTGFHNYGSFSPVPLETVTAWMPLPEPYKEEEE